ncbi:MAG: hypothetical protein U0637_13390 [Phycisphaerales bacterium]
MTDPAPNNPSKPSRTVFTRGKYAPPMAAPQYNRAPAQARFSPGTPAAKPPLTKPRKVKNGVKLSVTATGEAVPVGAWAAQRWMRLVEQAGEGNALVEGLEYAKEGQTKKLAITPGRVEAVVQGRADRPYTTSLTMDVIGHEDWDKAVHAMSEGAIYAAKLLAAELPPNIEDVFGPLGLRLFPAGPQEMRASCTCSDFERKTRDAKESGVAVHWCKHLCCIAYLVASRLAGEPFLAFGLRGMDTHELLDRLRQRRQVVGAAMGATPVYPARVPGVSDIDCPPLDANLAAFWRMGDGAKDLDLSPQPPQVSHPLLRRLGQSPWTGAAPAPSFPLVGLLASCYETISNQALADIPASDDSSETKESSG